MDFSIISSQYLQCYTFELNDEKILQRHAPDVIGLKCSSDNYNNGKHKKLYKNMMREIENAEVCIDDVSAISIAVNAANIFQGRRNIWKR